MLEILSSQSGLAEKDRAMTGGKCTVNSRRIMEKTPKYKLIPLAQDQSVDSGIDEVHSKRFICQRSSFFNYEIILVFSDL